MSEKDVEIVRRSVEAMVREDWEAAVADFSPAFEGYDHDIPDADVYIGPAGFLDWMSQWGESWDRWTVEESEFRSAPDGRVLTLHRMKATGSASGIEVDRLDGAVYTLADGDIVRIDYFNDQRQALEAAGLSGQAAKK
jgi:ketosteroid isomerase-like protein